MSKADKEVIEMLLWLVLLTVSTGLCTKAIAVVWVVIHAIAAILATLEEVGE